MLGGSVAVLVLGLLTSTASATAGAVRSSAAVHPVTAAPRRGPLSVTRSPRRAVRVSTSERSAEAAAIAARRAAVRSSCPDPGKPCTLPLSPRVIPQGLIPAGLEAAGSTDLRAGGASARRLVARARRRLAARTSSGPVDPAASEGDGPDDLVPSGSAPGLFSLPPQAVGWSVGGLLLAPDGTMWEEVQDGIASVSPGGTVTAYPAPNIWYGVGGGQQLAEGADGNVWFTWCVPDSNNLNGEPVGGGIGRVTPSGSVQEYQIDQLIGCPGSIIAGGDGRIWIDDMNGESDLVYAATITGSFNVTSYPLDESSCGCELSGVSDITAGTSGALTLDGGIDSPGCYFCAALLTVSSDGSGSVDVLGADTPDIYYLATDDGAVWAVSSVFGSSSATYVDEVQGGSLTVYSDSELDVSGIGVGPDGDVWLAGYGGLTRVGASGSFTTYALPAGCGGDGGISSFATGPGGTIWLGGLSLCSVTTAGTASVVIPSADEDEPSYGIAAGPGASMWSVGTFGQVCGSDAEQPCGVDWVSETLPSGTVTVWQFPETVSRTPTLFFGGPASIVQGSDGNMWFTVPMDDQIGRVTPAGVVTLFPLPASDFTVPSGQSEPLGITAGTDGALWFSTFIIMPGDNDAGGSYVGRITTGGAVSSFPVSGGGSLIGGITSGPDGDLWAPGYDAGTSKLALLRITTTGEFTDLDVGAASDAAPEDISEFDSVVATPSGRLWMSNDEPSVMYEVSPNGQFDRYPMTGTFPQGLALGADGSVYFMDNLGALGRLSPAGALYTLSLSSLLPAGVTLASAPGGDLWLAGLPEVRVNLTATGPDAAETVGGGSEVEKPTTCSASWPVDCETGEFWHSFTDVTVPGRGMPLQFTRTYSSALSSSLGPLGYGWADSYAMGVSTDSSTGDVTVQQQDGAQVVFVPDGFGGYTAPSRVLATLVANAGGGYVFTPVNGDQYTFDASGRLVSEVDRNGYLTSLSYNGQGQLAKVTDPAGRTLTFAYGSNGLMSSMTDPAGDIVNFGYDAADDLTQVTDQAGGVWSFTYDAAHRMVTMTDPDGGVTTNVYDSQGRVTSQKDPMGRVTSFAYGTDQTTITDPTGSKTVDSFTDGELASTTRAAGTSLAATTYYSYDLLTDALATVTNPAGETTSSTYDASGDVLSTTDPEGNTTASTYNGFGEPLVVTEPTGDTTTYSYDAQGNLLSIVRASADTTPSAQFTYAYGNPTYPGEVTGVTDALGRTTTYGYDADGDLTSVTDPLGDETRSVFDVLGRAKSVTSPRGTTTTYTYDPFGDVLTMTEPGGGVAKRVYNGDHVLVAATDATGRTSRYVYDADDELLRYERPGGSVLTETWTPDGQMASRSDGLRHTTGLSYNALGEQTAVTDPAGHSTRYGYDVAGELATVTDPLKRVTTYGYTADGQVASIVYSADKSADVHLVYDADGRRMAMTDGSGKTTYAYTYQGELAKITRTTGGTLSYGYDADGELTAITYPNGKRVTRGYDAAGRLTTVQDWLGHTTRFGYNTDSDPLTVTYPNRATTSTSYNSDDEPVSTVDRLGRAVELSSRLTRNLLGDVTKASAAGTQTGGAEAYAYTTLGQLAGDTSGKYGYDPADEITKMPGGSLTYNADDELVAMKPKSGKRVTYGYDALGERTSGGPTRSGYDQAGQLVSYRDGKQRDTFTYDGDGLRVSARLGATRQTDVWDVAQGTPLLIAAGSTEFIDGPNGEPVEQITGNTVDYLQVDQSGSVRLLTTTAGKVAGTYRYTSYGAVSRHTGASTVLGFTGALTDPDGLVYLQARYYNPATAQFLTVDPLVNETDEPYAYADDDPVNASDPTGRCAVTIPPEAFTIAQLGLSGGCLFFDGGLLAPVCDFNDALNMTSDLYHQDPVALTLDSGSVLSGLSSDDDPTVGVSNSASDQDTSSAGAEQPTVVGTSAGGMDGGPSTDIDSDSTSSDQQAWDVAGVLNMYVGATGDLLAGSGDAPTGNTPATADPAESAISDFQTSGFLCRPTANVANLQLNCSY